jgi:HEPN domain-containing protein
MPGESEKRTTVREWAEKAEHDLLTASHMLGLGRRCPTDTVCFHAQQCIEKYIKAAMVWRDIEFPRIHDIAVLLSALPRDLRPDLIPAEQERLTHAATRLRYPGADNPSLAEARQAVRSARAVRRELRARLARVLGRRGGR